MKCVEKKEDQEEEVRSEEGCQLRRRVVELSSCEGPWPLAASGSVVLRPCRGARGFVKESCKYDQASQGCQG